MTVFHVRVTGSDEGPGTATEPFRTIDRAAQAAFAGDTVVVHDGEYREWVRPRHPGLSDRRRVTFCAAPGEHVVVKGSERITGWRLEEGTVWSCEIPNAVFGDWNPYALPVAGDWLVKPGAGAAPCHLGDVYLDGRSLVEAARRADVLHPGRDLQVVDEWTGLPAAAHPSRTAGLVWHAAVGAETTQIWANFGGVDPNEALTEINVRRSVFYPAEHHIDYITVRGFELAHAATPWAPPTADQPGLIGPNWAKGWVIEDNVIHDAKCSAVSIGKERSSGHNYFSERHDKPGYQYQLESVFTARRNGWDKNSIGSHVVRNNTIFDCGQNGIVGHLGCVFSRIEDNEIFNIGTKREFYGHEIAGIKLHAAIDVGITHNHIHDCTLGIWLDWQAQGSRVSRNVLYDNNRDLFVEVSHGPYIVDHNILASPVSIESMSDGGAYVRNLVAGTLRVQPVMDRATPYHVPHSTDIAGFAVAYSGDDRFLGNIFVKTVDAAARAADVYSRPVPEFARVAYGTAAYDGHPASLDEYIGAVEQGLPGDLGIFLALRNPVLVRGNVYLHGARAYEREADAFSDPHDPGVRLTRSASGEVTLVMTLPTGFGARLLGPVTAGELGHVRMVGAEYEDPAGGPAKLDTDLLGRPEPGACPPGPLAGLAAGQNEIRVW